MRHFINSLISKANIKVCLVTVKTKDWQVVMAILGLWGITVWTIWLRSWIAKRGLKVRIDNKLWRRYLLIRKSV
jgi:hypothetical protein